MDLFLKKITVAAAAVLSNRTIARLSLNLLYQCAFFFTYPSTSLSRLFLSPSTASSSCVSVSLPPPSSVPFDLSDASSSGDGECENESEVKRIMRVMILTVVAERNSGGR